MKRINDSPVSIQAPADVVLTPQGSSKCSNKVHQKLAKIKASSLVSQTSNYATLSPQYKNKITVACTGFHNLPSNILVRVFSNFSEREISRCLAPVCRNWRFASQDASLWKTIQFKGNRVSTDIICGMLRRAKQLEAVSLVNVPEIVTILRQICRTNSQIKHIAVKSCSKANQDELIPEKIFWHLIRSCQKIESLDLDNTQFLPHNFIRDLLRLSHLRSINLSNNVHLRARDLVTLSHNCWKLEELKVARRKMTSEINCLTDTDTQLIFDNLKNSLRTVKFDLNGLGAASYDAIFKCSKIESLRLNNAFYLTGDILQSLPVSLPNIKRLKIERADLLLPDDFVELFEMHENIMKNLTCLKLEGCWKLDNSGMKKIVDTCASSIECLSVRSCKLLTVESIQYAVTNCHKLRYLNIAHLFELSEPSMMLLVRTAPSLKVLIIDDCSSNEGTLSHVILTKPQLLIKRSFSEYFKHQPRFIAA